MSDGDASTTTNWEFSLIDLIFVWAGIWALLNRKTLWAWATGLDSPWRSLADGVILILVAEGVVTVLGVAALVFVLLFLGYTAVDDYRRGVGP